MGWEGRERQRRHRPRASVLMDIHNLELRSLFTKLCLGNTLVFDSENLGVTHIRRKLGAGVCCSVLQCVAVRCSALQCVAGSNSHQEETRSSESSVCKTPCIFTH